MIDFIHITALDILDILMVAILMYQLYRLIRRSNAMGIFTGILLLYFVWIVVRALNMTLLSLILGQVLGVGVIALIVVFQPEIRKFLFLLGSRYSKRKNFWTRLLFGNSTAGSFEWVDKVVDACSAMSSTRTGALIVISRSSDYEELISQGIFIDSAIEKSLLESIFFKNSPLHDGAVVISEGRIKYVRCILPVSHSAEIPSYLGTRHRAAFGVTEVSDAVVVVVSEERGSVSLVATGEIHSNIDYSTLHRMLIESLS